MAGRLLALRDELEDSKAELAGTEVFPEAGAVGAFGACRVGLRWGGGGGGGMAVKSAAAEEAAFDDACCFLSTAFRMSVPAPTPTLVFCVRGLSGLRAVFSKFSVFEGVSLATPLRVFIGCCRASAAANLPLSLFVCEFSFAAQLLSGTEASEKISMA